MKLRGGEFSTGTTGNFQSGIDTCAQRGVQLEGVFNIEQYFGYTDFRVSSTSAKSIGTSCDQRLGRAVPLLSPYSLSGGPEGDALKVADVRAGPDILGAAKGNSISMKPPPNQIVEELTGLVRDLHVLLESHGPTWYTEEMDWRINETLSASTGLETERSMIDCTKTTFNVEPL